MPIHEGGHSEPPLPSSSWLYPTKPTLPPLPHHPDLPCPDPHHSYLSRPDPSHPDLTHPDTQPSPTWPNPPRLLTQTCYSIYLKLIIWLNWGPVSSTVSGGRTSLRIFNPPNQLGFHTQQKIVPDWLRNALIITCAEGENSSFKTVLYNSFKYMV